MTFKILLILGQKQSDIASKAAAPRKDNLTLRVIGNYSGMKS
ncbi:hypothetical protein MCHI_002167 [Candidatus Magnetoovum chiemensis]|nr:hypothetical protein MCHI_002167 [Candidatus Magnetoovum chiemensis]